MIVKAMEDKDRAHRGRKFWCWSEFRSFKQTKGIKRLTVEGQKRFVHRHCFGNVAHETRGLLRRCHVA